MRLLRAASFAVVGALYGAVGGAYAGAYWGWSRRPQPRHWQPFELDIDVEEPSYN